MKNILLIAGALLIILAGVYYFFSSSSTYTKDPAPVIETAEVITPVTETINKPLPQEVVETKANEPTSEIGESVSGEKIIAYHFGDGEDEILFIGGIHGGYSWNTALLSFELIDWLKENEGTLPNNIKVTVIPVLNPDGLEKVTGSTERFTALDVVKDEAPKIAGRFNAKQVDLNRNFDCQWQPTGTWQNRSVSGGTAAFSEPESQALRSYVLTNKPVAAITWYSAAGGVYASSCSGEPSAETSVLTSLFAKASGYTAHEKFDYYEITGDMVNWLASQNIPAISVLLTDRVETEFNKNLAGVKAVLNHYAK